ncbi:hypothetical protein ABBQ32_008076 [Trebouxia sp. C0010 RCD-2024]
MVNPVSHCKLGASLARLTSLDDRKLCGCELALQINRQAGPVAEANLKKEVAALAREEESMARNSAADHDIIHLNVGGTVLATRRSTLTQAKGSTLAAMFSGRWEHCLARDREGRIFLDFDPDLFQPILSFLRTVTICSKPDKRPMLLGVSASKKQSLHRSHPE